MSRTARTGTATLSPAAAAAAEAARQAERRRREEERRRREEARRAERIRVAGETVRAADDATLDLLARIDAGLRAWGGGELPDIARQRIERLRADTARARDAAPSAAGPTPNEAEAAAAAAQGRLTAAQQLAVTLRDGPASGEGDDPRAERARTLTELRQLLAGADDRADDTLGTRRAAETGLARLSGFAERGDWDAFDRLVGDVRSDVDAHLGAARHAAVEAAAARAQAQAALVQLEEETAAQRHECDRIGHHPAALGRLDALVAACRAALAHDDHDAFGRATREARAAFWEADAAVDDWHEREQRRLTLEIAVAHAARAAGWRVEPEPVEVHSDDGERTRVITARQRDDTAVRFWVATDDAGAERIICSADDLPDDRGRPVADIGACRDLDDALGLVRDALADHDVDLAPWQLADPASRPPEGAAATPVPTGSQIPRGTTA